MKIIVSKEVSRSRFPLPLALAIGSIASGLLMLCFVFFPILWLELDYTIHSYQSSTPSSVSAPSPTPVKPASEDFGIVIPKINANAPIIKNVDAFDSNAYQQSLAKGVAHAKGTSTPDTAGNTFLFAHSAQNWLNANRYNAVFYLLYKLEKGDTFSVYYQGKEYVYKIEEKKTVSAENVDGMKASAYPRSVTLMTCWPPGTTFQRLLVVGSLREVR